MSMCLIQTTETRTGVQLGEEARDRLYDYGVPVHMHEGIIAYVEQGRPVGDFLQAVISNDLRLACLHADDENFPAIPNFCRWFFNYAPSPAWGSIDGYKAWIAGHTWVSEARERAGLS